MNRLRLRRLMGLMNRGGAAVVPWYNAGGVDNTHVAAWQPMGAASLAESYLKLGGASFGNANLDPAVVGAGVAPTHAVPSGWTFNGIDQFLDTGIIPNGGAWSCLVRFSDKGGATGTMLFGAMSNSTTQFDTTPDNGGKVSYHNGGLVSLAPAIASGVVGVSGNVAYRNGAAETGSIPAWSGVLARSVFIGAKNTGSAGAFAQVRIQAIIFSDLTWTPAQAAALTTAMSAITVPT